MLRIPMRGYENMVYDGKDAVIALRIPMRGYESASSGFFLDSIGVTNPHAGL